MTACTVLVALLAGLIAPVTTFAHGNHSPKHGGIVKTMGETAIELVILADGAEVFLTEEVDPISSEGLKGKIIVVKDGARSEALLTPAGGNRLAAKGLKIAKGSRVSVQITMTDGLKVGANYAVP